MCANGSSHAQAPSVPIRRAGRSARDEIQVLLYAFSGEKSVIGGTCNPSVAPHLHRWLVREVRSEFSQSVARASGRSSGTLVCFFCNFSFKQRKVYNPVPGGKGSLCTDGSLRGVGGGASPSPTMKNQSRARTGDCAEMECTRAPFVFLLRKNPPPVTFCEA